MVNVNPANILSQVKSQLGGLIRGTYRDALTRVIPGFNIIEQQVMPLLNRRKAQILGKRQDKTVVDQGEVNEVQRNLSAELGGSYNPIAIAWKMVKALFGNSKLERTQTELNIYKEYSGLYDNYKFANESLTFLKDKMHQVIAKKEGMASKLGLKKNKKVANDPFLQELKQTFQSWLTPFEQVLSGGVKGVGLYKADIDFLQGLVQSLRHGRHKEYLKDMADPVERVLQKIMAQKQKQAQAKRQQAMQQKNSQKRNSEAIGRQLASMAK